MKTSWCILPTILLAFACSEGPSAVDSGLKGTDALNPDAGVPEDTIPSRDRDISTRDADETDDGAIVPLPDPLIDEPFEDANLGDRGWSRSLQSCAAVADEILGHNVIECRFKAGTSSPVGGTDGSRFSFDEGLSEITLRFKERVSAGFELGRTLHGMMAMSTKGEYSPANSHRSVYFEPSNSSVRSGEWSLKIQDNRNINCDYGIENLFDITETRSVGGCQQTPQRDGAIAPWCWGDPCEGGLGKYTGQSGWTASPTLASRPLSIGDWIEVIYYMRLNTPGEFDGEGFIAVRHPEDDKFVPVLHTTKLMTRTTGPSRDVEMNQILFGPWASSNKHNFTVRFIG